MENYLDQTYQAAIYLRLSKEDGDFSSSREKKESNSIANQRKLIEDYLKHYPEIAFVQEFCDDGYTGADFNRPAFQQMIEQVRCGNINCIIVKDLSRFGRDYIDAGRYIEKIFPALGVRFIAINDNYDSSKTAQAGNEIILPFKNLINDSYSRDISIKVRSNLDIKRRNGEFVGTHVLYGYQRSADNKNRLVIDKTAAMVVQNIFRMKIDGFSPAQIAETLNHDGVPSPYEYKRRCGSHFQTGFRKQVQTEWSPVSIYRILKDEMYTGTLVQGKTSTPNHKVKVRSKKDSSEWIRIENAHEAIIPAATFDMVQKLMLEDSRSPSGEACVHLFSGKVFCADCQSSMTRKRTISAGKEYVYFICTSNKKDKNVCHPHRITEQAIYDAALAVIQAQVSLALELEPALQKLGSVSWEHRELERIENSISRQKDIINYNKKMKTMIYEDFKAEIITLDEYGILKEDCNKKIQDAKDAIERLHSNRNQVNAGLTGQQTWLSQFRQYENIQELNRRVVVHFIDRIEITNDKQINVVLNNADQFQTILEFLKKYQGSISTQKVIPLIQEVG